MKTIIFICALSWGTSAFAISVDQFCSQFTWDTEKIECFKTVSGKYVDENALSICQLFSFDSDKKQCLSTILNKTYTPSEIKTCRNMTFDSEKAKCLVDLGMSSLPPTQRRDMDDIRKLSILAQDALRMNDLFTVQRALNQIYQISNRP